ncbi:arsenate reductase ArsC [Sphingomonas canadensis]|uniref:Arsenate reductase ArsC n=1 Tax=Sphingomonas canadensis TaxID=1219257 RepID=A0ABW3H713_9SPHN|nr:arsenate reductase ArsC [Sphingomonas canadensis]MCW3836170.1 arsenate reductase ArsC [Sphingomonas canadensis]
MSVDRVRNVLVLCTGNSARSILGEALINRDGAGRFRAFSAGSFPKGQVHPMALTVLREAGVAVDGYRSKSWDEFAAPGAPPIDIVVTVCDNAAGETCPIWPGAPVRAHWGIDDPAAVEGPGQHAAFVRAYEQLARRVAMLLALDEEALAGPGLAARLNAIGQTADAPAHAG